ncbi:hypothetical protein GH714_033245 [Hevea brasiliensis]|uniref:Rx N-terminal domain-containing protein n=1 Tax=Hevea brasiliensis TaxID=3981 RepID=A0A6A6M4Z5_HEVBR|nr:hypothetical protein GH714_033245 [Hevea brasiliensis]
MLRDVLYDAEDVVNEFECEALRRKVSSLGTRPESSYKLRAFESHYNRRYLQKTSYQFGHRKSREHERTRDCRHNRASSHSIHFRHQFPLPERRNFSQNIHTCIGYHTEQNKNRVIKDFDICPGRSYSVEQKDFILGGSFASSYDNMEWLSRSAFGTVINMNTISNLQECFFAERVFSIKVLYIGGSSVLLTFDSRSLWNIFWKNERG